MGVASLRNLFQPRIEGIAQTVSEQVEPEDRDEDRESREER
jgi:hypothetical protein